MCVSKINLLSVIHISGWLRWLLASKMHFDSILSPPPPPTAPGWMTLAPQIFNSGLLCYLTTRNMRSLRIDHICIPCETFLIALSECSNFVSSSRLVFVQLVYVILFFMSSLVHRVTACWINVTTILLRNQEYLIYGTYKYKPVNCHWLHNAGVFCIAIF